MKFFKEGIDKVIGGGKRDVGIGLDIGGSKVVIIVGQIKENLIHIVGVGKSTNYGMRRGMVSDIEEVVSAISSAAEEAERMAGFPLTGTTIGICGPHIQAAETKGVIAVSRADGEIAPTDIQRAIDSVKTVALPPNQEILSIIPQSYTIDSQVDIQDPVGMSGIRLELNALIITASAMAVKNLSKCASQAGLDIREIIYTPVSNSQILINKRQKELGVGLLDVGAGSTSLAIFEEGRLIHTAVLPIGSLHLTNDIAIGLRTSIETAEKIKLKYATSDSKTVKDNDEIDLGKIDSSLNEKISRQYLTEIVEARLAEIFTMLRDELKKIGKDGMLPAGLILTGGGSQLHGLIDKAKDELRLPVQLGLPVIEVSGVVDKLDDPVYTTAIGLMMESLGNKESHNQLGKIGQIGNLGGLTSSLKNILKQFIP